MVHSFVTCTSQSGRSVAPGVAMIIMDQSRTTSATMADPASTAAVCASIPSVVPAVVHTTVSHPIPSTALTHRDYVLNLLLSYKYNHYGCNSRLQKGWCDICLSGSSSLVTPSLSCCVHFLLPLVYSSVHMFRQPDMSEWRQVPAGLV